MEFFEQLKEMTNKELIDYCNRNGIKIKAKKKTSPTKKELLESIRDAMEDNSVKLEPETIDDKLEEIDQKFGDELSEDEELYEEDNSDNQDDEDVDLNEILSKKKKDAMELIKEKKRLERVIIRLNSEYPEKTKPNQLQEVSWGNAILGSNHEVFPLNKVWHLTVGALDVIEKIIYNKPITDDRGNIVDTVPIKKFFVERLKPLTKAELKELAKKQAIESSR